MNTTDLNTNSLNSSLHASRIEKSEDLDLVHETVKKWGEIAAKKYALEHEPIFYTSKTICDCIEILTSQGFWDPFYEKVVICKNLGRIQAIMIHTSNYKIISLATHPHNIHSKANRDELNRATGAASTLIRFAESEVLASNIDSITLSSTRESRSFYEKHNFTHLWDNYMEKTADTIRFETAHRLETL